MFLRRITFSKYTSGARVNYFTYNVNMLLTKYSRYGKIISNTDNVCVLGVF